jgi:predicted dehydrogenase
MSERVSRRHLLGATAAISTAMNASAAGKMSSAGRVIGANDRINVAVIGTGGRGFYVSREFHEAGKNGANAQIVGVCDVYQKRVTKAKEWYKAQGQEVSGTLDYREVLNRSDIDAVIVATPDHWHAPIAIAAMDAGKDVYLEKPMCHTVEETKQLMDTVKETKRVLQVGSQTTSGDQWHQAKRVIGEGMLGRLLLSQGSYHRNSVEGEWNWPIDTSAGPDGKGDDFIDWKMWLGNAPKRAYNADRFFRFRKYWDYSGGIATDLFYHVVAPMNICWGNPQAPYKVMAGGGIHEFKDEREVPDTFHLIGEYSNGHSIVLSSCMANSQHIPGLIRGHGATLTMVEHGRFEGFAPHITLKPELNRQGKFIVPELEDKFKGEKEIKIPVQEVNTMQTHTKNFLSCMRTRQKPTLDVETGARAQVLITMAVRSYREGKVFYFDEKNWKVVDKPPVRS